MTEAAKPEEIQQLADLLYATTRAGKNADQEERKLAHMIMPIIYAYPHHAMGAPEEIQAEYLEFALERIMNRNALRQYDKTKACFSTWLNAVLYRLYLDFLRQSPKEVMMTPFADGLEQAVADEDKRLKALHNEEDRQAHAILKKMELRCRVLFKLLVCESAELSPEEFLWLQKETKLPTPELIKRIAQGTSPVRDLQAELVEEYDKLKSSLWRLQQAEKTSLRIPPEDDNEKLRIDSLIQKHRSSYRKQSDQLCRAGKLPTMPYEMIAAVMNLSPKTVSSQISRCRQSALAIRSESANAERKKGETDGA